MKNLKLQMLLVALIMLSFAFKGKCQNDVMMQAFYWNVPTDVVNKNGTWYTNLTGKMTELKTAGFTSLWSPPPSKGNWGIEDVGYGIYDQYDLGYYNQKGSTETRYGSKAELTSFLSSAHSTANGPRIDVFADVVLNHTYGNFSDASGIQNEEPNPGLKAYVRTEKALSYQTSDIKWVIPNAAAGDYYIQIKGYNVDWGWVVGERGYNVNVNWLSSAETDPGQWEYEPNNGGGQYNTLTSGVTKRAHADYSGDIDEYKITLTSTKTIIIKLTAMRENGTNWEWADQLRGYYPVNVWYNGSNIALTTLEARTPTKSTYPTHLAGEGTFQWGWADYHQGDANDWLGGDDGTDNIIPNQRWFGNDFNTYSSQVQTRMNDWGVWLTNTIGFDGYRLDFVRGFQIAYVSSWINNLPKIGGTTQRWIVGEYWTENRSRLKQWIDGNAALGSTVNVFDFPLRAKLKDLCNGTQSSFNMAWLNHSGMVRADDGNAVSGTSVCTFLDNHDNAKNSAQWVTKDWKLGYAYILTHEGRPCVFYNHFYGVAEQDWENGHPEISVTPPAALKSDIKQLMFVRKTYLGGGLVVLSEVGNPYPSGDTYNVYVARRAGNGTKSGAIVVLNNNDTQTKGLWINTYATGYATWAGQVLKNAFTGATVTVQADGRVWVEAPARGYSAYVLSSEYVTIPDANKSGSITGGDVQIIKDENNLSKNDVITELAVSLYPNPANGRANLEINLPQTSFVRIDLTNIAGQTVKTVYNDNLSEGHNVLELDLNNMKSGVYFCTSSVNGKLNVTKLFVK